MNIITLPTKTKAVENTTNSITQAQKVLMLESQALADLAENLNGDFADAVETIFATNGRVIVSGMGKSGHIGAKIAATLASTGTPSFFVHPGEASHGDLGMVTSDDVVIAISHSGETKELGDVIAHCNRFNIPLIAITGKTASTLGKAANITLCDGVVEEACPINLAPTSSTTAALALGDALAVALMHRRNFKPEDFAKYHPGGKLGSRLVTVSELMASGDAMPLVEENTTMAQALLVISSKRFGAVGVLGKNGDLAGIITDGDLRRKMSDNLMSLSVNEVMTSNPMTIEKSALAAKAVNFMQEKEITCLFVMEAKNSAKPVGVIHIHDCLKAGVV